MLRIGLMRHRVTIQQRTSTQGGFGEQLKTWTDILTCWAHIEALSGSQLARAQSIYTQTTHKVTLRWQRGLNDVKSTGAYRIMYGTRIFDIGADLNIEERNRVIELMAREGLNEGQ